MTASSNGYELKHITLLAEERKKILIGESPYTFLNSIVGGKAFSGKVDPTTMGIRSSLSSSERSELFENLEEYGNFMEDVIRPIATSHYDSNEITLYRCLGVTNIPAMGSSFLSILPTSWARNKSVSIDWCTSIEHALYRVIYISKFNLYDPLLLLSYSDPPSKDTPVAYNQLQTEVLVPPCKLTVRSMLNVEGIYYITLDNDASWDKYGQYVTATAAGLLGDEETGAPEWDISDSSWDMPMPSGQMEQLRRMWQQEGKGLS